MVTLSKSFPSRLLFSREEEDLEGKSFTCGCVKNYLREIVEDIGCQAKALESFSLRPESMVQGEFAFPCVCSVNAGISQLLMTLLS